MGFVCVALVGCGGDDDDGKKKTADSGTPNPGWRAAVGDDGTFAQTFDDQSWTVAKVSDRDLHAVTCVGNSDGWAVGEGGVVLHTVDSGATWSAQDAKTNVTLRTVHFAHSHAAVTGFVGVVAGDDGVLRFSTDGGADWRVVTGLPSVTLRASTAALAGALFVVAGEGGTVLSTSDRGKTWSTTAVSGAGAFRGVSATPDGQLVLAVDDAGGVWASKDFATSFSREHTAKAALASVSVASDGSVALAVGATGTLLRRDATGTWSESSVSGGEGLLAAMISHANDYEYVAGESGALYGRARTAENFTRVQLGTTAALRGLEDLDPR